MTENDKMEELSRKYIEVLANIGGYFNQTGRDYGTDLTLRKAEKSPYRDRLLTRGRAVDIQLKAVHKRYVRYNASYITYDLEVKNYNDLVERKQSNGDYIPLYLIVFIVPNRYDEWLHHTSAELKIRECAYWFEINSTAQKSDNVATKSINIPIANLVDSQLFDTIFNQLT